MARVGITAVAHAKMVAIKPVANTFFTAFPFAATMAALEPNTDARRDQQATNRHARGEGGINAWPT